MTEEKWFYSTWFIALLCSLWILVVPLIFGIILMIKARKRKISHLEEIIAQMNTKREQLLAKEKRILKQEKDLTNRELELEKISVQKQKELATRKLVQHLKMISITKNKQMELNQFEAAIMERRKRLQEVFRKKHKKINSLKHQISSMEKQRIDLEDEILLQSFGLYQSKFDMENSQEYVSQLAVIRYRQKQLVKNKTATNHHSGWQLNGNSRKGDTQNNKSIKLAIRSFNNECDVAINKVKFNNIEIAEKKIHSSFETLNNLNKYNLISITEDYLNLKIEELYLVYEYRQKKQEELEEQRRINALIQEERRAQKELEEELKKLKKEEQHLLNVISRLSSQISEEKKLQYTARLNEIREQKEQIDYRVKNTKAGYVYIISNIGCFGEDVYKIGMTRRLDPFDRVRELGAASVPFKFDIHAIIFSENAPSLEATLHRTFHHRRVNKINERKEFFRVTLEEIKKIVHQNHNSFIEFTMLAQAQEYRETQKLEIKLAKQHII
ncbi:DUF4041 domain-containing protein [Peribacillus frigoritolerans]|uniref:DUF4041 domain-containing protein n=1 Tax=Peribacillus frigoritolerans TaxID=450367 RepID=UPI0034E0A9F6